MKTSLTLFSLCATLYASAQINNSSFENWSNLTSHTYESEMIVNHQVPDPMHGDLDSWSADYNVGISRTTDAADGNYAVILHNWYNYAQTSLVYRGTINAYPELLSGMYKYLSADTGDTAFAQVIIKNTQDEVMVEEVFHFGRDSAWTQFTHQLPAPVNTQYPVDSIYILFHNALTSCDQNLMTCNLLFLDKIELQMGAAGLNEMEEADFRIFPNPAEDRLHIEWLNANGMAFQWEIVDMSGRRQLHGTLEPTSGELNVSALQVGTYMLRISDQGTVLKREQILIR